MTQTAFKPLTTAEKIFKDVIWDPGIRSGELAIEGYAPILALPVVRQIEEGTINEISDLLFSRLCLFFDVTAIKLVDDRRQSAYEEASVNLSVIAIEKGIDSDEYKKARDEALDVQRRFGHFNG